MRTFALLAVTAALSFFHAPEAFAQTATLEQAKDLVKKGRAYLRQNGCKKTFDEISNGKSLADEKHKELYLYVYNEKLDNLAHGGNNKLVGKNLWDMRD